MSGGTAVRGSLSAPVRLQPSGEEAGTAPDDRRFRPDVEGLRAVAIGLVVLYHANVPHLTGGYVGVDVFFVISGFVITGLLLRERSGTGRTSIQHFYARRVRRILPAATVVILVTVLGTYIALGVVSGSSAANDGRWAAVFLSNFHFAWVGTNYFTAGRPPSPLQNYWSLSVEEQFYIVYPTLFLLAARTKIRLSLRTRLALVLGIIIAISFCLSVLQTSSNPTQAYFSPFTRAWELALGALVAVGTPVMKGLPRRVAASMTWAGIAVVLLAAFAFDNQTAYPGYLVALPVLGAALVIGGGTAAIPRVGAERILGSRPFEWLGRRSYSLYLWHWPILILAAERVSKTTLPLWESLLLVALALMLSAATYNSVENPLRHWRLPSVKSLLLGFALVVSTLVVLTMAISAEQVSPFNVVVSPAANGSVVLGEVAAAPTITSVQPSIRRAGYGVAYEDGANYSYCEAGFDQSSIAICPFGDTKSKRMMVIYGDSHASMWIPTLAPIASAQHLKLVVLAKLGCPASPLTIGRFLNPRLAVAGITEEPPDAVKACDAWHTWATRWIEAHRPSYVLISQADLYGPPVGSPSSFVPFSDQRWREGLQTLFRSLSAPESHVAVVGTTPALSQAGPSCLERHPSAVQACSSPASAAVPPLSRVDKATAMEDGVQYIDTTPWFCSSVCTAVIGKYEVYDTSGVHVGSAWAKYLQNVFAQALGLQEQSG